MPADRRPLAALILAIAATVLGAVGCANRGDNAGNAADPRDGSAGTAVVVEVTDGDTIRVDHAGTEERVRLIGIDTPETHGQGGLRECFGNEASRRTAELLPKGTTVRLVRDVEARDRYGRLLAYVYRDDGVFVNLRLAEEGFAAPLTIPPNIAHRDAFAAASAAAREANRGLWGRCGGPDTPLRRIAPLPSPP